MGLQRVGRSGIRRSPCGQTEVVAAAEPRVLVVGPDGLIASSLAIALRHAGFPRVATVKHEELRTGKAPAIELAPGDIALVGLLDRDGTATLEPIRHLVRRGCRVLVMASDQGLPLAGECLHCGAEAVLDMAMSFERLVKALRHIMAGGRAMTDDEHAALVASVERQQSAERALREPFRGLTEREADVLAALVAGAAPKQIALGKGITISTVRGHIQRVLSKLDVSNQREAWAMARHAGWP